MPSGVRGRKFRGLMRSLKDASGQYRNFSAWVAARARGAAMEHVGNTCKHKGTRKHTQQQGHINTHKHVHMETDQPKGLQQPHPPLSLLFILTYRKVRRMQEGRDWKQKLDLYESHLKANVSKPDKMECGRVAPGFNSHVSTGQSKANPYESSQTCPHGNLINPY